MENIKIVKSDLNNNSNLRVAAYCRVSTDSEEQLGSFNSQMIYYKNKISENPKWELVNIYADKGITGTKVEIRDGFKRMLEDCHKGIIDLILVKSISRFARNTLDVLKYVRELKELNVAILFEDENINTSTIEGELLLTVLSSVAQQEVENISANVKRGIAMKCECGDIIGGPAVYGYVYDKENKKYRINPEEAKIIIFIFDEYCKGRGVSAISKKLRSMGIKTKKGNEVWSHTAILDIIKNEKYKGDILYGKKITIDPISKIRVKNDGLENMYYIENHHEGIVSREVWDKANAIWKKRKKEKLDLGLDYKKQFLCMYPMSGKVYCGYCGHKVYRRTASKTTKESKCVWKCNNNIRNGAQACPESKSVDEEALEKAFVEAFNRLITFDRGIFKKFISSLLEILEYNSPSKELNDLSERANRLEMRKNKLEILYSNGGISKDDFEDKQYAIVKEIMELDSKISQLNDIENTNISMLNKTEIIKSTLNENFKLTGFDKDIFNMLVSKIIVGGKNEDGVSDPNMVTFVFNLDDNKNVGMNAKITKLIDFDCEYDYYNFETDELGFRTRIELHSFKVIVGYEEFN